ncbi:YcdB/YcdC domain-containing protein [Brevibacillus centrosporus]|uniref:YcdB/YcdC domain-containing protein n=1 Tax=Brevibacillus centrosporus TaxID=54910 RepID=UPI0037F57C85
MLRKWNKAAFLLVAASLLASPATWIEPSIAHASINKSEVEIIPLPADLVQVLKDLKEDFVPALGNLHTDAFTKEGSEYRVKLSDKKSKITSGVSLDLTVDENGNILALELKDPDRDKTKHFDKKAVYKNAVSFIREQVGVDIAVSTAGYLATQRGTATDQLLVVPFYQTQNDVPLSKKMGEVMLDANGQVVMFNQKKQKLPAGTEAADPKKAVAADQAMKEWEEALTMELVYDQEIGKLVYVPENEPKIDSLTGRIAPDLYVEVKEERKIKGAATKDVWKDQKSMEKMLGEDLHLTLNRLRYDFVNENDKKADVSIHEWKAVANESVKITLDRKTRTPLRIEVEGQAEKELETPLTAEEGKRAAQQFVERYLHAKEQAFVLKTTSLAKQLPAWVDQEQGRLHPKYRYDFYPEVNGIPVKSAAYTIEVDAKKGKVVFAQVNDAVALPPSQVSKQGLIGEQSAKEAFLKQVKLRSSYWYAKAANQTAELQQLVYEATEDSLSHAVDAHNGGLVDSWLAWEE